MRRGRLGRLIDCCYHVTHRCQEKRFLLRFKRDRRNYLTRLREAADRTSVDVLDYAVTSNHVHLLLWAEDGQSVSRAMQYVQGAAARDYNRRKQRNGAYWADRFHPTLVQTGSHLSRCLFYIGLNMVRAGAVSHPLEWEGSGCRELMGSCRHDPIINLDRLLWCLGMPGRDSQFRDWYCGTIDELSRSYLVREPVWSEAAAIGDRKWIEQLAGRIAVGRRHIAEMPPVPGNVGMVYDAPGTSYALHVTRRASDAFLAYPDYNERRRLQLQFSKSMVDWCFAGLVATGSIEKASRHYASIAIDGNDLVVLSRSGDERAKTPHDGNIITFHRVKNFGSLVY